MERREGGGKKRKKTGVGDPKLSGRRCAGPGLAGEDLPGSRPLCGRADPKKRRKGLGVKQAGIGQKIKFKNSKPRPKNAIGLGAGKGNKGEKKGKRHKKGDAIIGFSRRGHPRGAEPSPKAGFGGKRYRGTGRWPRYFFVSRNSPLAPTPPQIRHGAPGPPIFRPQAEAPVPQAAGRQYTKRAGLQKFWGRRPQPRKKVNIRKYLPKKKS